MKILQIFKEANGHYSANRVVFVGATTTFVAIWAFLSLRAGAVQPITIEQTALIGTLAAGKVLQKSMEQPTNENQPEGLSNE